MKILLTNDIHGCKPWYDWLLSQARHVDIVAIAGDLFDGFSDDGLIPQFLAFDAFVAQMRQTGCHLAFSTGNHDGNVAQDVDAMLRAFRRCGASNRRAQEIVTSEYWSDAFEIRDSPGLGSVVVDNRARVLSFRSGERLLVSTHPYSFDDSETGNAALWETASKMRAEQRVSWLALHHEPPAGTAIGGIDGSHQLYWNIGATPPNYVTSGHLHGVPFFNGGSWMDTIGPTAVFNPGQSSRKTAAFPNHVVLDTTKRLAHWNATDIKNAVTVSESRSL